MGRTKLDTRIRTLIENGVKTRHRSMFVIIGDKARDQIPILYHILAKATITSRPSVLWCYKKDLGFSSHRKKRMKDIQKKVSAGVMHAREDDPFELFISSTEVRYCYYADSQKILGNTFGMLVLQDFEALTPNLMARTVETIEGGGLVVFLLQSVNSLRQLYTLTMDVHNRYRTEAHVNVVPRFNERFILSLGICKTCVVMDDRLHVLPISSHIFKIEPIVTNSTNLLSLHEEELKSLQNEMSETPPFGALLKCCKTVCQANTLLKLLDVATNKTLNETCSITAARGRGKSAVLGLAIAGVVVFKFTNIFVTSPTPENLRTLFEFVIKGLEALNYQEHADFEVIKSLERDQNKCVVRINIFREHRQLIQYILPTEATKLGPAELVVIDEAAAIPMPLVRELISGNYLVFLASTINGYEGTGRSLSLKLLEQLRRQTNAVEKVDKNGEYKNFTGISLRRKLYEITLEESIRYKSGDNIEQWLNKLLCLDTVNLRHSISGTPPPENCELYYVNRDTLFSFHKGSEIFLANMMSIYVSAHYKNSPNDLQMLSDAPAHHLFVLMAPVQTEQTSVPQILAVVQVCLEGALSCQNVTNSLEQGRRAAGDLIPWTISQQFLDGDFSTLRGARIVRIAVHPDFQSMGYGSQAMRLIAKYFNGEFPFVGENTTAVENVMDSNNVENKNEEKNFVILEEEVEPRANLPSLLMRLGERRAEQLDYLGVSFGLTLGLLKFWKRAGFLPVYLRQNANDLTGEHTCIVLKAVKSLSNFEGNNNKDYDAKWLTYYFREFRHRFISLLGFSFSKFSPHLALSLIHLNLADEQSQTVKPLSRIELAVIFSNSDLRRIAEYARNMVDQNLITDLLPTIASTYFNEQIEVTIDIRQAAVLLSVGLQRKIIDKVAKELDLPVNQTFALLNKAIRRLSECFDLICKTAIEEQMSLTLNTEHMEKMIEQMTPTLKSLEEDLLDAELEIRERQQKDKKKLEKEMSADKGLTARFSIRGNDEDWADAVANIDLRSAKSGIISVKSNKQTVKLADDDLTLKTPNEETTGARVLNKSLRKRKRN